jgi:hypothetical protein
MVTRYQYDNRTVYIYCPMTPDFPLWAGGFAAQIRRLRTTISPTLHQLELLFSAWIVPWRLAQQDEGPIPATGGTRSSFWNLSHGLRRNAGALVRVGNYRIRTIITPPPQPFLTPHARPRRVQISPLRPLSNYIDFHPHGILHIYCLVVDTPSNIL